MVTIQHEVAKPSTLAATYAGLLEQELVLPNLFLKKGIEDFKGEEDDTVTIKVPGRLPSREYAWRNDRAEEIVFDVYRESKIAVQFGGHVYSGVKITDEQADFDLVSASSLLPVQSKAIAAGLTRRCAREFTNDARFEVIIRNAEANLRAAIIQARGVLNKFQLPNEARYLVVGSDFEAALLMDDKLNLTQNVPEQDAASALRNAIITQKYGFTIVVDQTIQPGSAYAMTASAFVLLTGAPSIPASVPFGATTSYEGLALRWMRDYETVRFQDRSVVDCYAGTEAILDQFVYWDEAADPKQEKVAPSQHFVRAIKLELAAGTTKAPAANSDLSKITGVNVNSVKAITAPASA